MGWLHAKRLVDLLFRRSCDDLAAPAQASFFERHFSLNRDVTQVSEMPFRPSREQHRDSRKGGVPKERVLNCLSKDEFARYLEELRGRRRGKMAPSRQVLRPPATTASKPPALPVPARKSATR